MVNIERLDKLMKQKRPPWGLGELAQYSGLKYDTVFSLRSGRRPNTRASTLVKIADALNTSVDYLLGEVDDPAPSPKALPEPIRTLVDIAGRLSQTRQEELLRVASALEALGREQEIENLDPDAMQRLLAFAQQVQADGEHNDLVPLIELLLRRMPRRPPGNLGAQDSHDPGQGDGEM